MLKAGSEAKKCHDKHCLEMTEEGMFGNGKRGNLSHVAFLQLGDFPLQLLVVCIAGSHPRGDNSAHEENTSISLSCFDTAKKNLCKTYFFQAKQELSS